MSPKYVLVIHAGIEDVARENLHPDSERQRLDTLRQSLASGRDELDKNGRALDAVETAIKVLEDSPFFNAGRGSVFTNEGRNEMDASLMNGQTLEAGAVAASTSIKNPISAARLVIEISGHVLLIGDGAEQFAQEKGLERADPSYFHTRQRWEEYLQEKKKSQEGQLSKGSMNKYGTVGAVSLDRHGNLAAGSSTGGIANKKHGRVGDSPIIGAGIYADNATCAVSCTGQGEYFIRQVAAHRVCALMEFRRLSLKEAASEVLQKIKALGGHGGLIAVDKTGRAAMPFVTPGMYRGLARQGRPSQVAIYSPW